MACKNPGRSLAYEADAQGEEYALEGNGERGMDAVDDLPGRLLTRSVAVDLFDANVVEVGDVVNETTAVVFVYGFRADGVDIHGSTGNEVFDSPFDLRWATRVVGTVVGCFAIVAYQLRTAFRATVDKLNGLSRGVAAGEIYAHDFRNDFAAFLDINVVAQVEVEAADEVFVVECSAAHSGSGQ